MECAGPEAEAQITMLGRLLVMKVGAGRTCYHTSRRLVYIMQDKEAPMLVGNKAEEA